MLEHAGRAALALGPEAFCLIRQLAHHGLALETRYQVTARDRGGRLLWTAEAKNRVVTAGLNKVLDSTFSAGSGGTPTWYVGLVGPSVTDGAITATTAALASASNPWVSSDAGRSIIVRGAGRPAPICSPPSRRSSRRAP